MWITQQICVKRRPHDSGLGFISGFTTNASHFFVTILSWVLSTLTPPSPAIGNFFLKEMALNSFKKKW